MTRCRARPGLSREARLLRELAESHTPQLGSEGPQNGGGGAWWPRKGLACSAPCRPWEGEGGDAVSLAWVEHAFRGTEAALAPGSIQ